ncbi:MAG: PA0069 family radical SAM protein [Vampirovibrio sp.]|nr:PA0069 family radical SAM protein [Vampirovibrio sp.]
MPNKALHPVLKGRGASINPTGRFESIEIIPDPEFLDFQELDPDAAHSQKTRYFVDDAKTIVTTNDSPDIGMDTSMNIYRGCEHGCIYCYARPGHEYFGLSVGLDFETKIFVKTKAPQLLREKLSSKSWQPTPVVMSGVTDCYQPIERELKLTRQCLQVFLDHRNPVGIITKNHLITRDIDILSELASRQLVNVFLSVTTLDPELARIMEPRTAQPHRRLDAIRQLSEAGIPVGVMMAPIIPGLTDWEIPRLFKAIAAAGARTVGFKIVRLPHGNKDLFETWLADHFPDKQKKVLNRIKDTYGGKLYDATYGVRGSGTGLYADHIKNQVKLYKHRYGLTQRMKPLSVDAFRRTPEAEQLSLL